MLSNRYLPNTAAPARVSTSRLGLPKATGLLLVCLGVWAGPVLPAENEPAQRASVTLEEATAFACSIKPIIAPSQGQANASLEADRAALEEDGIARASGSVRLEKGEQALEAPELTYDRKTSRAKASQGLKYYRPGISLIAGSADVNVRDQTGRFMQAEFALSEGGGRGGAERVESLGPGLYELHVADYSTCPGEKKAWRLSAERIELDQNEGRGEAFGATLLLFEWPVFYLPYINYPIDDERHTGFLLPVLGTSNRSGFELAQPYYINIAPGRDATITPRLLTERGIQLGGEFRYLNPNSTGRAAVEYLPSDSKTGNDRSLLQFEHVGRWSEHFGVDANYTRVSDDDYFEDLGRNVSSTSQSQLEQELELSYAATGVRLSGLVQNFQTLDDDRITPFRITPYKRLPQAMLSLKSPTRPWSVGLDAEFVNFARDQSVDGLRYDARPRVALNLDHGGWFARSQASYRYTHYDLRDTAPGSDNSLNRGIPNFSADTGLRFERLLQNGWLQTLEPRLFYLYNGFDNQDNLPLFDTGVPDLRYERLFADNRFLGTDRIGDANQVTLGVTSRFINPESGRPVVELNLGRIYSFSPIDVRLANGTPIGFGDRHSDIVSNAEYRPLPYLHGGIALQYDTDQNRVNRGSLRTGYQDDAGRRLDFGYRYYRNFRSADSRLAQGRFETLEQTDILLEAPVFEGLKVFGRWNYSLESSQSVQSMGGLEYRPSCCWAVRGAWQRFVNNDQGEYNTAILLQFELTGLGQFGDDTKQLLEPDSERVDSGFNGFLYP